MTEENHLLTYAEAAVKIGIKVKSLSRKINRLDIEAKRVGKFKRLTEEQFDQIRKSVGKRVVKRNVRVQSNANKIFYRVSVLEPVLGAYIVKKCSLTKREAVTLTEQYEKQGLITRYSPCRKLLKPGRK